MRGPSSLLEEVKQVNFSYLSLIREVAQKQGAVGLCQMGFSEDIANSFVTMTDAQLLKLADSGQLLCRFQMNTAAMLSSLGNPAESRMQAAKNNLLAAAVAA